MRQPRGVTPSTTALSRDEFWAVLDTIPPATPVCDMTTTLRRLSPAERRDFAHHLAEAVAGLDTPEHRREMAHARETSLVSDPDVVWTAAQPGLPALPLELQLTVVALGREAWAAVVRTPAVLRGAWPTQLGRKLAHALATASSLDLEHAASARPGSPAPVA